MSLLQAPEIKANFDYDADAEAIKDFLRKTKGRPILETDPLDGDENDAHEDELDDDVLMELDDANSTRRKRTGRVFFLFFFDAL